MIMLNFNFKLWTDFHDWKSKQISPAQVSADTERTVLEGNGVFGTGKWVKEFGRESDAGLRRCEETTTIMEFLISCQRWLWNLFSCTYFCNPLAIVLRLFNLCSCSAPVKWFYWTATGGDRCNRLQSTAICCRANCTACNAHLSNFRPHPINGVWKVHLLPFCLDLTYKADF